MLLSTDRGKRGGGGGGQVSTLFSYVDCILPYLCFYNKYIYSYNFYSKNKLFKLIIAMLVGIGISFIEVSGQKLVTTSLQC